MPTPARTRITWSGIRGSVVAPLETWSFSLNTRPDPLMDAFTEVQMKGVATAATTAYNAAWPPEMPSDVILTQTRVALLDGLGKTKVRADGSYRQGIDLQPISGGKALNYMPLQAALVVSLTTGRAGPSGKGRFFLPWPGFNPNTQDKRLSTTDTVTLMNAARAFIVAVNAISLPVVVASSKGYLTDVTGLRVGRVPDTLRSRRRDALEAYETRSLAAS